MTTRSLPKTFPTLNAKSYFSRKISRARLLSDIAQAQNYLWANMYRVYSMNGYAGFGNTFKLRADDLPTIELAPDSSSYLKCVGEFAVPPNWAASNTLILQGRSVIANCVAPSEGRVYALITDLSGNLISYEYVSYTTIGNNDWTFYVELPKDKTVVVRICLWNDLTTSGLPALTWGEHTLNCISGRYHLGTAAEIGGDAVTAVWKPLAHAAAIDGPYSSAMLVNLVNDTNHLFSHRPPEVIQAWMGQTWVDDSTFTEVGRYTVWCPSRVLTLGGRILSYQTHSGAGNEFRVLVDGVVVQTVTALSLGEQTTTLSAITVTDNAYHTITIEAKSTAAAADWGTIIEGVYFWEEAPTLALPAGTAVPSDYEPVDEDLLEADKANVAELNGSVRAGLKALMENNTWLAYNRLRYLVADWRHRTYKRIDTEGLGFTGTSAECGWDWTRGPNSEPHQLGAPKNITVRGDNTTADATGVTSHTDKDGRGNYPNGYSTAGGVSLTSWPVTQGYKTHGLRLGRYYTDPGTGVDAIALDATARIKWLTQARRVMPACLYEYDTGTDGPKVEEEAFKDRGFLHWDSSVGAVHLIISSATRKDTEKAWYGPSIALHVDIGSAFDIVGRCPYNPAVGVAVNILEGALNEIEVCGNLIWDEPLRQDQLDAL